MSKKIIFFILLFNLTGYAGVASSEVVPLKKPIQTKEETQKKLLIDVLKPLPKPIEQTEKKVIEEKVIVKKESKKDIYKDMLAKDRLFSISKLWNDKKSKF